MMAEFTVSGLTFILNVLAVLTQDITSKVYCNKSKQTWQAAQEDCRGANGRLVAYVTGLGVNVDNIPLNNATDVWTADYAKQPTRMNNYERLCGFHFVSQNKQYSEVMFGDCSAQRHYLCKNNTTNKLDVLTNTRDHIRCPDVVSNVDLNYYWHNILPGYYWVQDILNVTTDKATQQIPVQRTVLCGAYTSGIGKYFVNCFKKRSSLCRMDPDMIYTLFDKSCFDHGLESSTEESLSQHTALSTDRNLNTTIQSTVEKMSTISFDTIATNSVNAARKTLHNGIRYVWTTVSGESKLEKQKENDKNISVTVGLPVGICTAVICGIILSIYILRRYKQQRRKAEDSSGHEETVYQNVVISTRSQNEYMTLQYEQGSANPASNYEMLSPKEDKT